MAAQTEGQYERLLELWPGMAIYRVHLDALVERDKNARVMAPDKFDRLSANIKKDKRLESLPLCTFADNAEGNKKFLILSGHHRTRAARTAALLEIYVLCLEDDLSKNQIISKQLAHNALAGYDNKDVLAELYAEIDDINEKMASGLTDLEVKLSNDKVKFEDLQIALDYEQIYMLFLKRDEERFKEILETLEKDSKIYIADKGDFDRFKKTVQETSRAADIRNISGIMLRMMDIVDEYHVRLAAETPPAEPVTEAVEAPA